MTHPKADGLDALKREAADAYIKYSEGNCDQCSFEAVKWVIDHLAQRGMLQGAWQTIDTFDHRMFSVMSNGTPDGAEVVKYKGEVPEWATHWKPL